ncbi:MAG: DNA translocase FtsK [Bacteroidales bacterium]|nr:DNA translocase FtsK [Bacteroidales bacterium]
MAERSVSKKTKSAGKSKMTAKERAQAKLETEVPAKKDVAYLICGLSSLALSVYTLVSLISYLFTWADDQSLFDNNGVFGTVMQVENGGGAIGLVWANFLISKLFGLGAFIIPFFFGGVALFCLRIKKIRVLRFFALSLFGCVILSVAFSFIFSFTRFDSWFGNGAGGSYGHYITMWLKLLLGNIGAASVILLAVITWMVAVNRKFVTMFNNWIDRITAPRPKKEKKRAEADEVVEEPEASEEMAVAGEAELSGEDIDLGSGERVNTETGEITYEIKDEEGADDEGIVDLSEDEPFELESVEADDDAKGDAGSEETAEVELEVLSAPETPVGNDIVVEPEKPKGEDDFLSELSDEELSTLFDPRLDLSSYQAPPLNLLEDYKDKWYEVSKEELAKNNRQIVVTLANYKIGVSKISARIGPTVTLYEIVPAPGVRVSQIKRLEEDIQLSLAARGVRVVTLPGTNAIGIEVANEKPSVVSMLSVLDDPKFKEADYQLPIAFGKTITNEVFSFDLAKMPHLLVAGATGQGKSVGLNAILASLLYKKHPSELKLVLVDPKKVELSLYSKLEKHFLAQLPDADEPVITDTQKVIYTLKSLCMEMDSRYDLLRLAGVRNIKEYNEKFLQRRLNPLKGHKFMPFIVVVIDEFADLIMTAGRDIEGPIARLAQLARAIGIHLVIATQRPTTAVITGNIKANFPARIAFMVRSSIDSKTILDEVGAKQLIGRGDALISTGGDLTRVQCALIETKEVERIVDFIGEQRGYTTPYYLPEYTGDDKESDGGTVGAVDLNKRDSLFEEAAKLIVMHQQGSTSLIQRKMNLGYNRAGRIMDQLEVAGIVGPFEGSKARQVLVSDLSELDARLANIKDIYG